jgi:uncharacterized damage-inducible protein DinB
MSRVPTWFERKFDFTFPVEQYPNLCARLRGSPARLEELMLGCGSEALVRKPEGKWSAQEHAGHLADLEPLWMARVNDFAAGGETFTGADLSNRKTDEANHNSRELREILAEFRAARLRLVERVEKCDAGQFANTMLHPRLKTPMRLVDHLFFAAEHDDHHLAKIWEIQHAEVGGRTSHGHVS